MFKNKVIKNLKKRQELIGQPNIITIIKKKHKYLKEKMQ